MKLVMPTALGEHGRAHGRVGVVDSTRERWIAGGGGEHERGQRKGEKEGCGSGLYRRWALAVEGRGAGAQ